MDRLINNQEQAEGTLQFLKQQLQILNQLATQKTNESEQAEIQKLVRENNLLEKDILKLKQDLKFYEAQNGVKQVSIPQSVKTIAEPSTATNMAEVQTTTASQTPIEEKENKNAPKKKVKKAEKPQAVCVGGANDKLPDVSRLNITVGKIIAVMKHPDADSLYVETVDVGEAKPRTIVSGLVKHVTLEKMQNRMAAFILNLKPAKMRGILSEGMIMCASTPEKVEILELPKDAAVGDKVVCLDFPGEPDAQLNPKKKIWEQVAPDMKVNEKGQPCYKGSVMTILGKGDCFAPTMKNCLVK